MPSLHICSDLVHALLTDTKGSSSLLFVGSYRDDEVPPDHAIVLFKNDLIKCNVPPTEIHLDGLCKESLNSMISDALGCFPRLTQKSLSEIVHRKTKGNPLFAVEFLGSLNRRGLLQFNSTEGRWIWDNDIIMAEHITDNVCHLLTTQMNGLSSGMQCAMKTASCFGTSIHLSFVGCLSAVEQYSTLMQDLDQAACDGFMNRVQIGYMFVHDKVREAAYGLIPVEERAQFHYNIGMLLYGMLNGQDLGDLLYPIIDQINYGSISLIVCPIHRISIAELNYDVAVKAMNSSYFKAAYLYLKRAVEMLPEGHWQSHHSLSRRFNLLLADASCACGNIDEATKCVNEILSECHSLDDKLDAYSTMANLFAIRNQGAKAYNLCEDVMSQLGETIPASFESTRLSQMVAESQRSLSLLTDSDIQGMREMEDQKQLVLMKFYNRISTASYYGRPDMFPYFACKIVELSLRHGVCKFSAKVNHIFCNLFMSFFSLAFLTSSKTTPMHLGLR